jgi:hypothetical protein
MKSWLCTGVLAAAIALPTLSSTQIPAFAQPAQEQRGQEEQGIEGVWDISVTVRSCATGAALFTGRVIHMFIDGGSLTEVADRANRSAGLGSWRHLGGRSYASVQKWIEYTAAGGDNGTGVVMREIELSENGDNFTAKSTSEVFNAAGQLISTGCATSTGTRFE